MNIISEKSIPFKLSIAQMNIGFPKTSINGLGLLYDEFAKRLPRPAIGTITFIFL
jgi:hypothetical protein